MSSVQKRPDGQWRARYRGPDGRERSRHFSRKLDATRWLDEVASAVVTGNWTDPARSRVKVGPWAARWLDAQAQLKPSTRVRYDALLRHQVLPTWSNVALVDVAHADVAAWVQRLAAGGLAAATVRQAHRVLHLVLELAVRDGRLPKNPAAGVGLPRAATPRKRFLSHDEVDELAQAAHEVAGRDSDRLVVLTLAFCGLRWGELSALRVGRFDPLRRRLEVAEAVSEINGTATWGTPKSHAARSVPVPRFLVDDLVQLAAGREPTDLLFQAPRGGLLRLMNWRRRVFDPAATSAGLEGLTPHELRHTSASLAVSAGANVKAVQRLLGHASAAMTLDVYSGLFGDDLDAVADRLDAAAMQHRQDRADQARTRAVVSRLG